MTTKEPECDPAKTNKSSDVNKKVVNGEFASPDEAAKAILEKANPLSMRDNLEYGGLIYKTKKGTYGYSGPTKGDEDGVNPWDGTADIPEGTKEIGYWHTHGDYSVYNSNDEIVRASDPKRDDFDSDHFSDPDIEVADYQAKDKDEYKAYVGTPMW